MRLSRLCPPPLPAVIGAPPRLKTNFSSGAITADIPQRYGSRITFVSYFLRASPSPGLPPGGDEVRGSGSSIPFAPLQPPSTHPFSYLPSLPFVLQYKLRNNDIVVTFFLSSFFLFFAGLSAPGISSSRGFSSR